MTSAQLILMRSAIVGAALAVLAGAASAQLPGGAEHEAIAYSTSAPADPVARLQQQIDAGTMTLEFDERRGYLPAVLKALDIPVSSQGLVFSKTSLQLDRIAPWSPRALYFNDDVYVGWVQGGPILEVASVDPKLGTMFYSLPQERSPKPRFAREGSTCLVCHDSSSITGGVPGLIVRSVFPDKYGYSISAVHEGATTDRTPIRARWGGWYVTGTLGDEEHMGNVMAPIPAHEVGNAQHYIAKGSIKPGAGNANLADRFDTEPYLSAHSDVVALMVLTHQAQVHNLITIAGYETRKALHEEGGNTEVTARRVRTAAEPLVRAMLFMREAPFTGPIAGSSAFATEFTARGPRDGKARSLRDLDLEGRLFRYPLSYLVYSESFDALPDVAKSHIYKRLRELLSGIDPGLAHVPSGSRQAALEILEATKPDFAEASPMR